MPNFKGIRLVYSAAAFLAQDPTDIAEATDHAGCLVTGRSTTVLVTMYGSHCIKHYLNAQSSVSLGSGESEFYANVRAASVGLSLHAMCGDWSGVGLKVSSGAVALPMSP